MAERIMSSVVFGSGVVWFLCALRTVATAAMYWMNPSDDTWDRLRASWGIWVQISISVVLLYLIWGVTFWGNVIDRIMEP